MGSRLAVRQSRYRVHQTATVMAHFVRIGIQHEDKAVALFHGNTQALLQTPFVRFRDYQLVDHHLDAVHLITVELHTVKNLFHLAVHTDIQIAFLPHLLEQFLIMPFTVTDQRSKQIRLLSPILIQDQLQRLLLGVLHHLLTAQVRISLSRPCIKQTEEVVNLGCRPDGRTRILVRRLLFDRDNRTQTGDLIHIRPLHIPQEITGVCGERLHITPLPFGKDRIKS